MVSFFVFGSQIHSHNESHNIRNNKNIESNRGSNNNEKRIISKQQIKKKEINVEKKTCSPVTVVTNWNRTLKAICYLCNETLINTFGRLIQLNRTNENSKFVDVGMNYFYSEQCQFPGNIYESLQLILVFLLFFFSQSFFFSLCILNV